MKECPICHKKVQNYDLFSTATTVKIKVEGKPTTLKYYINTCLACHNKHDHGIKAPPELILEKRLATENIIPEIIRHAIKNQDILEHIVTKTYGYTDEISRSLSGHNYERNFLIDRLLKLYPEQKKLGYKIHSLLYYNFMPLARVDTEETRKKSQYCYIPKSQDTYWEILNFIKEKYGHRNHFIDVGSGFGDKVMFADALGIFDECTGIEYKETYHSVATITSQQIRPNIKLINGDAFNHDYSLYDTIYMYHPLNNEKEMLRLYNHIWDSVEPGTIMIEAIGKYPSVEDFAKQHDIKIHTILEDCVAYWVKK